MSGRFEVLVVGGGQAGLALGYHLARQGRNFAILDASPRVGDAWRNRWDSLTLFTPARYSSLPGMAFPAHPDHLPGKDEVADYLEGYAAHFGLPVRSGEHVVAVRRAAEGSGFAVTTSRGLLEAEQVVIATGGFQRPYIPPLAAALAPGVVQLHSSDYRDPSQLPTGELLVVGGGNSGVQIAAELSAVGRTRLAVGEKMPRLPSSFLGRSIFGWLEASGAMDVSVESRAGRWMSRREVLIGTSPAMLCRTHGVELLGRAESARENRIGVRGGREVEVAGVVWATGFRPDFGILESSLLDERGAPLHRRGIGRERGMYFLGLPWQTTRGSALLGWVGRDAAEVARSIAVSPRIERAELTGRAAPPSPRCGRTRP
jgi:putative flavoprotein involved in K+ transport